MLVGKNSAEKYTCCSPPLPSPPELTVQEGRKINKAFAITSHFHTIAAPPKVCQNLVIHLLHLLKAWNNLSDELLRVSKNFREFRSKLCPMCYNLRQTQVI